MKKIRLSKSKLEGIERKAELIALAIGENETSYFFDLDTPKVRELYRECFAPVAQPIQQHIQTPKKPCGGCSRNKSEMRRNK